MNALGNYEVYAGVRAKSSRKYLQDSRIKFIDLALSDPTSLKQQLDREQFDCIFHFAGLTKAKRPEDFDKVNFGLTKNLADAINPQTTKLIFLSSFAAHGPAMSSGRSSSFSKFSGFNSSSIIILFFLFVLGYF